MTDRTSDRFSTGAVDKRLKMGRWSVPLPKSRGARMALGIALVIGGCLGFLPVLGFWMIPLGLLVLSHDIATVRRFRRRVAVWWGRRRSGAGKAR